MTRFDPDRQRRRSIRLAGRDYRRPAAYFMTACVQGWQRLLGEVIDGSTRPSAAGAMVAEVWQALPAYGEGIAVDAFVVMPHHVHGIVILSGTAATPHRASLSLSDIMQRFKSLTTARYRQGVHTDGWEPFHGRLWLRNYFERVIRTDEEIAQVRRYIRDNPLHWKGDEPLPLTWPLK